MKNMESATSKRMKEFAELEKEEELERQLKLAGIEEERIKAEKDKAELLAKVEAERKQQSEDDFLWALKHQDDEDEDLHPHEKSQIKEHSIRAEKKFKQLDVDENGYLEGDEITECAMWIWSSYNEGKSLTPEQRKTEGEKLLQRHDDNKDGRMSLDEFCAYFEKVRLAD